MALLGEELASAASIRDRTIADLHKSRLESAETNIKLADMTLKWKEGKGQWGKEKSSLLQSMEVPWDPSVPEVAASGVWQPDGSMEREVLAWGLAMWHPQGEQPPPLPSSLQHSTPAENPPTLC